MLAARPAAPLPRRRLRGPRIGPRRRRKGRVFGQPPGQQGNRSVGFGEAQRRHSRRGLEKVKDESGTQEYIAQVCTVAKRGLSFGLAGSGVGGAVVGFSLTLAWEFWGCILLCGLVCFVGACRTGSSPEGAGKGLPTPAVAISLRGGLFSRGKGVLQVG